MLTLAAVELSGRDARARASYYYCLRRTKFTTMATHTSAGPTPSLSNFSVPSYNQRNHIDLTLDDEEISNDSYSPRFAKRARTEIIPSRLQPLQVPSASSLISRNNSAIPSLSTFTSFNLKPATAIPGTPPMKPAHFQAPTTHAHNTHSNHAPTMYRPPFDGPSFAPPSSSSFYPPRQLQLPAMGPTPTRSPPFPAASPSVMTNHLPSELSDRQIIDLTGSPSPPPAIHQTQMTPTSLPTDLPPKTPVCIGQLTVTALVLYPVAYLLPQEPGSGEAEWASVRLQHEHNPSKPGGSETIHIKAPHGKTANGEAIAGEGFAVVEQKVATSLGPMLGKGLIRLDAKVRKGLPNVGVPLSALDLKSHRHCVASNTSTSDASLHTERKHSRCRKLSAPVWPLS